MNETTNGVSLEALGVAITAVGAIAGGIWAIVRRRGDVQLKAADLDLAWAERAESLWEKVHSLETEQEHLRKEIQAANGLTILLRDEVTSLREAIRTANDLAELKLQEQKIPTAARQSITLSIDGRS